MLALVKTAPGPGNLELREVPEPQPGPREVKIEVAAAGICGTDLHIMHGQAFAATPPVILGHEFTGVVVTVGPEVSTWQVGDRVTSEPPVRTCGVCEYCQSGLPALCAARRSLGSGVDGAFARYVVAPVTRLHRLPESVDFLSGALAEPAACCVHAVMEQGRVMAGDLVVVTGPGPIGLLAAQVAKAHGATVVLLGTAEDAQRLALGRQLGLDLAVAAGREEARARVQDVSEGRGADVVFECAGAGPAAAICLDVVKKKGRYVQVGLLTRPVELDFGVVVTKELNIRGSFGSTYTSWERALGLLAMGKIQTRPLVTADLPLREWSAAFSQMERREGCKVVLRPGNA